MRCAWEAVGWDWGTILYYYRIWDWRAGTGMSPGNYYECIMGWDWRAVIVKYNHMGLGICSGNPTVQVYSSTAQFEDHSPQLL